MKVIHKLLAPNIWVAVASLLALTGIGCIVLGSVVGPPVLSDIGFYLLMPLLAGAAFLILVVIPLLAINRNKQRMSAKSCFADHLAIWSELGERPWEEVPTAGPSPVIAFSDRTAGVAESLLRFLLKTGHHLETRLAERSDGEIDYFQWGVPEIPGVPLSESGLLALVHDLAAHGVLTRRETVLSHDSCEYKVEWILRTRDENAEEGSGRWGGRLRSEAARSKPSTATDEPSA